MNMLDIGGGFTGSELQLEEVCSVLKVAVYFDLGRQSVLL